MKKEEIRWNLFSKYRSQLFGIAIIWIMLFHIIELKTTRLPRMFIDCYGFLVHGNLGVEIFLLLSGLGLYYSYSKIEEDNIILFYKNRIKRLLMSYIIINGSFFFIQDIIFKKSVVIFLKDISTYSFYSYGNRAVWFIAFIIPLYLIYPFIYKYVLKNKKSLLYISLMIFTIYVLLYILKINYIYEYIKLEIALTRIPVFLAGCYIGKLAYENKIVSTLQKTCILILIIIGLYAFEHKDFSLYTWKAMRLYYFLLGIPFTWMFVILLDFLNSNMINQLLLKAGEVSLELYLSHVAILHTVLSTAIYKNSQYKSLIIFASVFCGAFVISIIVGDVIIPKIRKIMKG